MNDISSNHSVATKAAGAGGGGMNVANCTTEEGTCGAEPAVTNIDVQVSVTLDVDAKAYTGIDAIKGSGVGVNFEAGVELVEESCDETKVVSVGVDTAPTMVGEGGGIGIGVVLTAVDTVKNDAGVSMTVAAIKFPIPEGCKCIQSVSLGAENSLVNADMSTATLNDCSSDTVEKKMMTSEVPCTVDDASRQGMQGTMDSTIALGSTNSDPVDARITTCGLGMVTTGTGAVLGDNCVIDVVQEVTLSCSSESLADGVMCASSLTVGNKDSGTIETLDVVDSAVLNADFEVNTTPGMIADESSGDQACTIATVMGPQEVSLQQLLSSGDPCVLVVQESVLIVVFVFKLLASVMGSKEPDTFDPSKCGRSQRRSFCLVDMPRVVRFRLVIFAV